MPQPADRAAKGKQGQRRVLGEIQGAGQGHEAEVDRGVLADQLAPGIGKGLGKLHSGGSGSDLGRKIEEGLAPRISFWVKRLAEAGNLLAPAETIC